MAEVKTVTRPVPERRPPWYLFVTEPARGALDAMTLLPAAPWLAHARRGHGEPVLVLPGLLATDASTVALRQYLSYLGYAVHGWQLGRNRGPTPAVVDGMPSALLRLYREYGRPVAIVGWSLGGIYARKLARTTPELINQVITLGSPYAMVDPSQCRAMPAYNRHAHRHVTAEELRNRPDVDHTPLPVPSTSVYSRSDGIVAWQACREAPGPQNENVAVRCSHLGFGHRPSVLWLVADRLAQPAGQWRPFTPPRALRSLYPRDASSTATSSRN